MTESCLRVCELEPTTIQWTGPTLSSQLLNPVSSLILTGHSYIAILEHTYICTVPAWGVEQEGAAL